MFGKTISNFSIKIINFNKFKATSVIHHHLKMKFDSNNLIIFSAIITLSLLFSFFIILNKTIFYLNS